MGDRHSRARGGQSPGRLSFCLSGLMGKSGLLGRVHRRSCPGPEGAGDRQAAEEAEAGEGKAF